MTDRTHPDSGFPGTRGDAGYTAADMATAAAQGFRDGVASLAASAAPLSCGHHASMMLMSAETGNPLYCELCDSIDRRRDAETIAEERRQQLVDMKSINAQLIDALKTVRSQESDLWAPWLIKQVDAALAKRPIAEHTSASLAANAGSEPVAWRVRRHDAPNYWIIFLHRPVDALADPEREVQPLYTHPSPPEGMVGGWVSVEERLPESDAPVLAHNGKWTGVAAWMSGDYLEPLERWQDEHREFIEMMGPAITHWMPLPPAPSTEGA